MISRPVGRAFLAAATLVFFAFSASAQRTAIGLKLGLTAYQGDLVPSHVDISQSRLGGGFFLRKNLNTKFAIRVAADFGTIRGADDQYPERVGRGFAFKTSIFGASLNAQWAPLARPRFDKNGELDRRFTPVLFTGLGAVVFNPKTAGLGLDAPENAREGMRYNLFVPLGIGGHYDVNEKWTVGLEILTHMPFSDYLDGVSESASPGNRDWFGLGVLSAQYWLDQPEKQKQTSPAPAERN